MKYIVFLSFITYFVYTNFNFKILKFRSKFEKDTSVPHISSPSSNNSGPSQMLPLKLADKKNPVVPNHSRTGSTPSSIPVVNTMTNPATR